MAPTIEMFSFYGRGLEARYFLRGNWGYTFTQELVSKGTIKNLPIFTQELHYGNYLPTYISLFSHRNYKILVPGEKGLLSSRD